MIASNNAERTTARKATGIHHQHNSLLAEFNVFAGSEEHRTKQIACIYQAGSAEGDPGHAYGGEGCECGRKAYGEVPMPGASRDPRQHLPFPDEQ